MYSSTSNKIKCNPVVVILTLYKTTKLEAEILQMTKVTQEIIFLGGMGFYKNIVRMRENDIH